MGEEVEIKSRELFYRGQPLEYLKKLSVRESAKYLPSSSRRYILRNFDTVEKFVTRCEKKLLMKKKIRTHQRDIVIVPKLSGMTIGVYSGKHFQDVTIVPEMIGHKLGEFVMTRSKVVHGSAGIGATKSSRAQKK